MRPLETVRPERTGRREATQKAVHGCRVRPFGWAGRIAAPGSAFDDAVELRGGVPQMGHEFVAHLRLGGVGGHEEDGDLHVRGLREPALLARPDERGKVPVDRREAGAGDALGARHDTVQRLRGLQAHTVRRTARDDHQPSVRGGLLLAVAEAVALGDARDVQDGPAVLGRLVVPQPQPRADAGAEAGLRELLLEAGEFLGLEVADEHRVQRQTGRAQAVHPADDLLDGVRAVGAVQRQVDGEALQPDVLYGGVQHAAGPARSRRAASSRTSPR